MKKLIALLLIASTSFGAEGWRIITDENDKVISAERARRINAYATPADGVIILSTEQVQGKTKHIYPPLTWQTPRDFVETVIETNEIDGVVTNDIYAATPRKYWTATTAGFDLLDTAGRDALDAQTDTDWVTDNTKSTKQLRAEGRVVELVTNSWPQVTFPLTDQQLSDLGDLVLVKVNTQRLDYGTQGTTALIGAFIADNEALSDLKNIVDYIEENWGSKPTDATFGRQVNTGDAP